MLEIIKSQTSILFEQSKIRKYEITHEGLIRITSVKPRAQELFIELLSRIRFNVDISGVLIECSYKDLGFNSFGNFSRYRTELVDRELLFIDKNTYYINPVYVNYYTRRQREYFFRLFKLKKDVKVVMNVPILAKVM